MGHGLGIFCVYQCAKGGQRLRDFKVWTQGRAVPGISGEKMTAYGSIAGRLPSRLYCYMLFETKLNYGPCIVLWPTKCGVATL